MNDTTSGKFQSTTSESAYYDLGAFHRSVSTKSDECQLWFDRGLTWIFGFNHEEAAMCFEKAIKADISCAMAYWGLAYALGPNYNKPWELFDECDLNKSVERTYWAANQARSNTASSTEVEQLLVDALKFRYQQDRPVKDLMIWNVEYADAMKRVYDSFPDDLDVVALYADALMNLTPWGLWDLRTGEPTRGARTIEAKTVLELALRQQGGYDHPGLLHLYIHLMEMSRTPEVACKVADRLCGLIPDAGHLHHMGSHIDILCGDYRHAISSNLQACDVDEKYLARAGGLNFYTFYRLHNYHFVIYAAMFAGQYKVAIDTVARMEASVTEEMLRTKSPPMADWLESFLSVRSHVLVRFGRWQDIIELQFPKDPELYCVTFATIHYAKTVALAATGKIDAAESERVRFQAAVKRVLPTRLQTNFPNKCVDVFAVAEAMLNGELEYRKGNYEVAFEHLRKSIELDDSLNYTEPWGWMQPARHAYAALLLEQGHIEEAAAAYSADLGFDDTLIRARQHPNNVWALHGYHECLTKLGRKAEAKIIGQQLKNAVAAADVPVKSSCFCRLESGAQTASDKKSCC